MVVVGRAVRLPRRVGAGLAVFGVAVLVRLGLTLRSSGGILGLYDYDTGVHYAAAMALLHGEVPYRDFVFLHPPLIPLVLTPFAWLGMLTSDHTGFVAATLAFCLLGGVNAYLVVRVARRLGLPPGAALVGGLFYALWLGSVWAEYQTRLEPLGNALALLGLLGLIAGRDQNSRWLRFLGGVGFGAAVATKIWWAAPLAVVVAWVALDQRSWRAVAATAAGALTALGLIVGPFLLLAPSQMVSMVIADQLHRPRLGPGLWVRLSDVTGLNTSNLNGSAHAVLPRPVLVIGVVAVCALGVGLVVRAWRVPAVRAVVLLALVQLVVLFATPSFFWFYVDFATVGLSLVVAGAVAAPARVRGPRTWAGLSAGYAALTAVLFLTLLPTEPVWPYPRTELAAATGRVDCVMSNSPMALIELNFLSRSFRTGCHDWVDVDGRRFTAPDRSHRRSNGHVEPAHDNPRWQRDLGRYLLAGQAVTLVPKRPGGIGTSLLRRIRSHPLLVTDDGFALYATSRHPSTSNRVDSTQTVKARHGPRHRRPVTPW